MQSIWTLLLFLFLPTFAFAEQSISLSAATIDNSFQTSLKEAHRNALNLGRIFFREGVFGIESRVGFRHTWGGGSQGGSFIPIAFRTSAQLTQDMVAGLMVQTPGQLNKPSESQISDRRVYDLYDR